ncbi:MAG: hypothetical protein AB8B92_11025 [Gammaproteobacteria bacterium]
MLKLLYISLLFLIFLTSPYSFAQNAVLPIVKGATPLLPEFRRKQVLDNIAKDSSAYDKHIELVKPYVLGRGKMHDTRNLFPGITIPIALYGKDKSKVPNASQWIEYVRANLVKHVVEHTKKTSLEAGKAASRNTFRQVTQDLLHSVLLLDRWYPQIWKGDDRAIIQKQLDTWSERLSEHYQTKLLFTDSDENVSWFAASLLLEKLVDGNLKTKMRAVRDGLLESHINTYYTGKNQSMAGGQWVESTSYNANSARFFLLARDTADISGLSNPNPNYYQEFARVTYLDMLSDESGVWLFNDHQDSSSKGKYQEAWPRVMNTGSKRTHAYIENALINSAGTPEGKAIKYFVRKKLSRKGKVGTRWNGYIDILFSDPKDSVPKSLAEIKNLPTWHDSGYKGTFKARRDLKVGAPQLYLATWNFRQNDHNGTSAYYEIWNEGMPITHSSSANRTSDSSYPVNTIYIENLNSSRAPNRDEAYFPGSQGPRSHQHGTPVTLGSTSNFEYATHTSENKDRYVLKSHNSDTNFLQQWTRSYIHDWDGLTVMYDHVVMDVKDVQDLRKRYKASFATYNRKVQRITRTTSVASSSGNGWYSWKAWGQAGHYKSLLGNAVVSVVDEQSDEPWKSAPSSKLWQNNKIAHLTEEIKGSGSNFDDIHLLGVLAWGKQGIKKPTDHPLLNISKGVVGYSFKHNGVSKVFLFNKNPNKPINKSISFALEQGMDTVNLEIFASGWSKQEKFDAKRSGNTIKIMVGVGNSADQGLLFKDTL